MSPRTISSSASTARIDAVDSLKENQGRLGVFWHTQGSGQEPSMVFFCAEGPAQRPGNWTFVIVTDRDELDDQIARTFAAHGRRDGEREDAPGASARHLRELLAGQRTLCLHADPQVPHRAGRAISGALGARRHHRHHRRGAPQPVRHARAEHARALPNAAFIGFTGTPLMAGRGDARSEVFGDYVCVYNFAQSIEDGATVPLYYENRMPELQLTNEDLDDEMEALLDEADLDEEQEKKLERQFARAVPPHHPRRPAGRDRRRPGAHFIGRGYRGKAMFVAIDKATAVRMYDKVQAHWGERSRS